MQLRLSVITVFCHSGSLNTCALLRDYHGLSFQGGWMRQLFLLSQVLGSEHLFSVFVKRTLLCASYKRNRIVVTVFVLFCLTGFIYHNISVSFMLWHGSGFLYLKHIMSLCVQLLVYAPLGVSPLGCCQDAAMIMDTRGLLSLGCHCGCLRVYLEYACQIIQHLSLWPFEAQPHCFPQQAYHWLLLATLPTALIFLINVKFILFC